MIHPNNAVLGPVVHIGTQFGGVLCGAWPDGNNAVHFTVMGNWVTCAECKVIQSGNLTPTTHSDRG